MKHGYTHYTRAAVTIAAIAMASEKFSLSFVSKVILSKDGTKLKVWS